MNVLFSILLAVLYAECASGQSVFVSNDVQPGSRPMGSTLNRPPRCGYVYVDRQLIYRDCANQVCTPIPDMENGYRNCSNGVKYDSWCVTTCESNFVMRGSRLNKCHADFKRWIYPFASCGTVCGPGYFLPRGTSLCKECSVGYYSAASSTEQCTSCAEGLTTYRKGSESSSECISLSN